jgi:hypothetical protein
VRLPDRQDGRCPRTLQGGRLDAGLLKEVETYVLNASGQPWYLELKGWNGRPLLDVATPDQLVVAAVPSAAASAPVQAQTQAPAKGK